MNESRDLMYTAVTRVSNTVWNSGNWLKEKISGVFIIHTQILCEEMVCLLVCGNHFTRYMDIRSPGYTLNIYSFY